MAINPGVNVSKLVAYAVLGPLPGVNVTKMNAYAVLGPLPGVNVTKLNAYVVLDSAVAPVWPSFSFGSGVVGIAYSQRFAVGGSVPITITVSAGALPPGLGLSAVDVRTGLVSGTPTLDGTYPFTLQASNTYGTSTEDFTIIVSPAPAGGGGGSFTWIA